VAGQVRTWVNLLTGLATIGTTIGSAAGGDADAIRVANMVIGWIRAIGNGQIPAVQISPSDLPGFVNYCQNIKPIIEGGLIGGYSLATTAIQTTNGGRGDANAQAALDTIVMWIMGGPGGGGGILNAICTLPQIQAAIQAAQAAAVPDCAGSIPNSQWNAAAGTCECMPGYSSAIQPGQCLPDSSASGSTQPSRFLNPALTRIVPSNTFRVQMQQCPDGSFIPRGGQCPQTGGGSAPSGPSGLLVVGVLAALGIGAYAYANR
jgi:hypothetical protein